MAEIQRGRIKNRVSLDFGMQTCQVLKGLQGTQHDTRAVQRRISNVLNNLFDSAHRDVVGNSTRVGWESQTFERAGLDI